MAEHEVVERRAGSTARGVRWRSGVAFLGGALAWTFHLLAAWAVAEWRCHDPAPQPLALGVTVTAWLLLGVTAVALTAAGASLRVAWADSVRRREEGGPQAYLAWTGFLMNAIFLWIILLQTVPVIYYSRGC